MLKRKQPAQDKETLDGVNILLHKAFIQGRTPNSDILG